MQIRFLLEECLTFVIALNVALSMKYCVCCLYTVSNKVRYTETTTNDTRFSNKLGLVQ